MPKYSKGDHISKFVIPLSSQLFHLFRVIELPQPPPLGPPPPPLTSRSPLTSRNSSLNDSRVANNLVLDFFSINSHWRATLVAYLFGQLIAQSDKIRQQRLQSAGPTTSPTPISPFPIVSYTERREFLDYP